MQMGTAKESQTYRGTVISAIHSKNAFETDRHAPHKATAAKAAIAAMRMMCRALVMSLFFTENQKLAQLEMLRRRKGGTNAQEPERLARRETAFTGFL